MLRALVQEPSLKAGFGARLYYNDTGTIRGCYYSFLGPLHHGFMVHSEPRKLEHGLRMMSAQIPNRSTERHGDNDAPTF